MALVCGGGYDTGQQQSGSRSHLHSDGQTVAVDTLDTTVTRSAVVTRHE